MAVVARTINALTAKEEWCHSAVSSLTVQVHLRPGNIEEEERLRYQEIKRGSGIIFTRRQRNEVMITYAIVRLLHCPSNQCGNPPNKPHTLDRAPLIQGGRFHQKRTCPDHDPCSLPIDHHSFRM
jgi:hypothetical protein